LGRKVVDYGREWSSCLGRDAGEVGGNVVALRARHAKVMGIR
jgi:hypothetical protein